MAKRKKVLIIGWDCAAPDIVFNRLKDKLPAVREMMEKGVWGNLRTCYPPITVPAWRVMFTGRDPGELGVYGFRSREGSSYDDFSIVTSNSIKVPAIWDVLGEKGGKSIVSNVPPSYPVKKINGHMISCFITPGPENEYTYPGRLKRKIKKLVGDYPFDVVFRTEKKAELKEDCFNMTEKHFKVLEFLLKKKKWELAAHVEIGLDRIHHGFWKYFDEKHHLYRQGSEYRDVIPDYYRLLDRWLAKFMNMVDEDTLVMVVSDHGAKRMKGAFCVNQWLESTGYLKLNTPPKPNQKILQADVDWERTKAWAWGGYYSRIFLNIKGREEKGIIEPGDAPSVISDLKKKILEMRGPDGSKWKNEVYEPGELYKNPKGIKPDLMVFWDDLSWRAAGTLGHESMFLPGNDTGPDDAVHDWNGIFLAWKKGWDKGIKVEGMKIQDIYPTLVKYLGMEDEYDSSGKPIEEVIR